MADHRIQLAYRAWASLRRDCDQQIRMRGLLVKTDAAPEQFAAITIGLQTPDGEDFDLEGEVVQVIPGQGVAVQFSPTCQPTVEELEKLCRDHPAGQDQALPDDPQVIVPDEDDGEAAPVADGSLLRQIEKMSVNEKRQAALRGRRDMRLMMIRDRNKTVHPFVIKNPSITLDEIEQIAKMPSVNPDVLRMIAANKEWNRSTTVCRNLVRNPKTPMREALALLAKLPISELRALAKSNNVRTPIQQAARKKVAG